MYAHESIYFRHVHRLTACSQGLALNWICVYCSDVNEVIQKVLAQEQQQTSLRDLSKDNHDKIESLNATITALRERVEELKYSGSGFMTVSVCSCYG